MIYEKLYTFFLEISILKCILLSPVQKILSYKIQGIVERKNSKYSAKSIVTISFFIIIYFELLGI